MLERKNMNDVNEIEKHLEIFKSKLPLNTEGDKSRAICQSYQPDDCIRDAILLCADNIPNGFFWTGSRAMGYERYDSDYDLMVSVSDPDRNMTFRNLITARGFTTNTKQYIGNRTFNYYCPDKKLNIILTSDKSVFERYHLSTLICRVYKITSRVNRIRVFKHSFHLDDDLVMLATQSVKNIDAKRKKPRQIFSAALDQ